VGRECATTGSLREGEEARLGADNTHQCSWAQLNPKRLGGTQQQTSQQGRRKEGGCGTCDFK
jgi:hypothetical protein